MSEESEQIDTYIDYQLKQEYFLKIARKAVFGKGHKSKTNKKTSKAMYMANILLETLGWLGRVIETAASLKYENIKLKKEIKQLKGGGLT